MLRVAAGRRKMRFVLLSLLALIPASATMAQETEASTSPAGLAMMVLFLGIAGIIGVFVIRWGQSTGEDDESR